MKIAARSLEREASQLDPGLKARPGTLATPLPARVQDEGSLSELQRDRFELLLRKLTAERAAICEAMVRAAAA